VSIVGFVKPDEPLVAEYATEPDVQSNFQLRDLQYMVLARPNSVQHVNMDPSFDGIGGFTDSPGIWLPGPGRLWLYDTAGLIPMADLSKTPIGTELPAIAGQCS
jgi:hypothetical protein